MTQTQTTPEQDDRAERAERFGVALEALRTAIKHIEQNVEPDIDRLHDCLRGGLWGAYGHFSVEDARVEIAKAEGSDR